MEAFLACSCFRRVSPNWGRCSGWLVLPTSSTVGSSFVDEPDIVGFGALILEVLGQYPFLVF